MVKSRQEELTWGDVLKTRHPAGRKWTDQFIYFYGLHVYPQVDAFFIASGSLVANWKLRLSVVATDAVY